MNGRKIIEQIIDSLPWHQKVDAEKKVLKYRLEQIEKVDKLSPEVTARLYRQVINEAKERGSNGKS